MDYRDGDNLSKEYGEDARLLSWRPVAVTADGGPTLPAGRLTPTRVADRGPYKVRCGHCHAVLLSGWSEEALRRIEVAACWKCGGTSAYASLRNPEL